MAIPQKLSLDLTHFKNTKPQNCLCEALKFIYSLFFSSQSLTITPTFGFISEPTPHSGFNCKVCQCAQEMASLLWFKNLEWSSQCHVYKNKHAGTRHHALSSGCMTRTANVQANTGSARTEEDKASPLCNASEILLLYFPGCFTSTSCFPSAWAWLRAMNLCVSFLWQSFPSHFRESLRLLFWISFPPPIFRTVWIILENQAGRLMAGVIWRKNELGVQSPLCVSVVITIS